MQDYRLVSINQQTLFEGRFFSFTACLEQAVKARTVLNELDLRHKNLSNANLDSALLAGADFTGTNLTGANLSECILQGANFSGSALYNTCFCDSNLSGCNFENASFGATDIHGAIMANARFSSLSCFTLDFSSVRQMGGCLFISRDGEPCRMSRPPLVIRGLAHEPIIIMDERVSRGHNVLRTDRLEQLFSRISTQQFHRRLGGICKSSS